MGRRQAAGAGVPVHCRAWGPDSVDRIGQVTTTPAGLVFALAALVDLGPTVGGFPLVSIVLQLAGLTALVAAGYAMQEQWRQAGVTWRDLFGIGQRSSDYPNGALMFTTWGLLLLTSAYRILAVDVSRR